MATLVECFTRWNPGLPLWDPSAQAVCACTFGRGDDRANHAIGLLTLLGCQTPMREALPYCMQQEVRDTLNSRSSFQGYVSAGNQDTHTGNYVGTYEAAAEQYHAFLKPRGITRIHVVAKYPHAWRVIRCYEKLGLHVVSCETNDIPWPDKSSQKWCRSALRFYPYEVLARLHYLRKGYI